METNIRILHWLRWLLLPAGLAGWPQKARQGIRLRRSKIPNKNTRPILQHYIAIKEINNIPMESRLRIVRWLSLLLLSAGLVGWAHKARQHTWFRRCEIPPGYKRSKSYTNNRIRQLKNILMKSRLRIVQWLSLLLLSAGLVGWAHKARQDTWFRRCEMPPGYKRSKSYTNNRIRQLKNILMKSRLRIVRWLSLLLLSAGLVGWSQREPQKGWFRRPDKNPDKHILFKWKETKQKIKIYNRTMKLQLQIMRWLSLLLLSEGLRWELDNLSHFAWFRRP